MNNLDICLYGTSKNITWIIGGLPEGTASSESLGDRPESLTDAVFSAVAYLNNRGYRSQDVYVYGPSGHSRAKINLGEPVPYYSGLKWEVAPVFTLDLASILQK